MSSMIKRREEGAFFKPPREFKRRCPGSSFPVGGPNTKRRAEENRKLNKSVPPEIKNRCEIRIPGICWNRTNLSWAHSKKTRFLTTSKDWQEAARACGPCHDYIERLPHKAMKAAVKAAIERRPPPPSS